MLRRSVLGIILVMAAATTVSGQTQAETNRPAKQSDCAVALSEADVTSIRAVIEAYRTAWLRGDSKGVLATFTTDAVLLPAHGASPVAGMAAITNYWFPPDALATTITKLDITVEDVSGGCGLASVYGHDDVEWTMVEKGVVKAHGHPGTYLNVMRKLPDGSWRISRHMWDDGPSR